MSEAGGRPILVAADVSDEQAVDQMFDQVLSEYGRPDILVNNAGIQIAEDSDELCLRPRRPPVLAAPPPACACGPAARLCLRPEPRLGGRRVLGRAVAEKQEPVLLAQRAQPPPLGTRKAGTGQDPLGIAPDQQR